MKKIVVSVAILVCASNLVAYNETREYIIQERPVYQQEPVADQEMLVQEIRTTPVLQEERILVERPVEYVETGAEYPVYYRREGIVEKAVELPGRAVEAAGDIVSGIGRALP